MTSTRLLKRDQPDVCHVHNTLPLVTPSVYAACQAAGVPVVQTLHNYRGICPGSLLLRNGQVCRECVGRSTFHAVRYGCYRGSRIQTLAVANMLQLHRRRGTWNTAVDAYIALSEFARGLFIEGGFPAERIYVKPNFLTEDPTPSRSAGQGFVFVGRLDSTKGTDVLAEAAHRFDQDQITLIGTGPRAESLDSHPQLELTGKLPREEIFERLGQAMALIFPSIWYEGMPMTILEAFACGCPVIASRLGAPEGMIDDGKTGLLFNPGDSNDLADKMQWAHEHPEAMAKMGHAARQEFENKYSAEQNYGQLMAIYSTVISGQGTGDTDMIQTTRATRQSGEAIPVAATH